MTLVMTVLTGLIYPLAVTGLCQALFRNQANGSLITVNGQVIGSRLIGQNFTKPEYFQPRPSAAGNDGYDATASSGSNLGPTNQKLIDRVKASVDKFHKDNPDYLGPLPADLVTASGSGLDPHISPASATAQIERIARARRNPRRASYAFDPIPHRRPRSGFPGRAPRECPALEPGSRPAVSSAAAEIFVTDLPAVRL